MNAPRRVVRPGARQHRYVTDSVREAAPLFAEHFKLHPRDIEKLTLGEFYDFVHLYNRRAHEASKEDR